ncbi:hypothetical protein RS030_142154 [Cryptosporidium xiaoi]|uniref:Uncharacterized protein n=1 Tax=Cryptosporidium xiaoi TaxID=659607 RepID=A0AAV9Y187_9CRYT
MTLTFRLITTTLTCLVITSCYCEEVEFLKPESLEDQIIKDVLSHANVTNIIVSKEGNNNVYQFYTNKTLAEKHTNQCKNDNSLLKYVNNTHTCYMLGNDTNYMINRIIEMTNNSTNITSDVLMDKLFKFDKEQNLFSVDNSNNKTELRFLANFHQLNYNEINHRRRNPRRRYIDEEDDDKYLSKKERRRRKKRRKKMRKKQEKLRKRRNQGFFDKVKSTVKWVACVQISVAVCGCCLSVVQSVVLSYFSPIPIGARIQPINAMYARGFEDYGLYGASYYNPFPNMNNGNNIFNNNNNNNLNNILGINNNFNDIMRNGIMGNMGGLNRN